MAPCTNDTQFLKCGTKGIIQPTDRDPLLVERQKTHGRFEDNARMMQAMKRIMEGSPKWDALSDRHKEALHMIVHKIGRIISGNPLTHDHWDDIAGYAKLGSEACDG
jgi:hypothetical protein